MRPRDFQIQSTTWSQNCFNCPALTTTFHMNETALMTPTAVNMVMTTTLYSTLLSHCNLSSEIKRPCIHPVVATILPEHSLYFVSIFLPFAPIITHYIVVLF